MIQKLQEDLNRLTKNNKEQQQGLQNLYLRFGSIINDQLQIIKYSQVSQNLLHKVRPETQNLIQDLDQQVWIEQKQFLINLKNQGLDYSLWKNIKKIQLITSQRANQTVIQMIPFRINHINQIILNLNHQIQVYTIQNTEQTNCQSLIEEYNNALDKLYKLNKEDLVELKRTRNPPTILVKVIIIICVLLDHSFKPEQQSWEECQKIIGNFNYVNSLHSLDIGKINESQLTYIKTIRQISEVQASKISNACSTFYQFILVVLQIRESKQYIFKRKIELIELLIKQAQKHQTFLQKMIE